MSDLNIAIADDNPQMLGKLQEILEAEEGFSVVGREKGQGAGRRENRSAYSKALCQQRGVHGTESGK